MPTNAISALTELAVAAFRMAQQNPPSRRSEFGSYGDAVLDNMPVSLYSTLAEVGTEYGAAVDALRDDSDISGVMARGGEMGPMFTFDGSGSRITPEGLVSSLLTSGFTRMYFLDLPKTEEVLARLVIENLEEIKKVMRGEPVRLYLVMGLSGIALDESSIIQMPWGTIRRAPEVSHPVAQAHWGGMGAFARTTTAVLTCPRLGMATVSTGDEAPSAPELPTEYFALQQQIANLQPLAFALATSDENRCAPLVTFATQLAPIQSGFGFSMGLGSPGIRPVVTIDSEVIPVIEEWGRRLSSHQAENMQVAATRIVSAIAQRLDPTDALIDAVTAWESLVGTRAETVFRVTAALVRLLEPDVEKRQAFRKELSQIYDRRSRVVHGDVVEPSELATAASDAIDVALQAMRALHERGEPWLSYTSQQRGDALILKH